MTFRHILGGIALIATPVLLSQVAIQPRTNRNTAKQTQNQDAALPNANLRVDTNLVLVPVTVNDEMNRPVTGLEKENFKVIDDGVEQTIASFSSEDDPIALGFIFDISGSMSSAIPQGRLAAAALLKYNNPGDEFFLVEFKDFPKVTIPLTENTGNISGEILMTKAGGSTALIDALYLGIHEIKKSTKTKKALVLISDGGDNHSRYTPNDLKNLVKESDVLIYTIGVGSPQYADERFGFGLMHQIAEMTGAHMFEASSYQLSDIAEKIGIELRNRYVIGYAPRDLKRDGRLHRIQIKLAPPKGLPKLRAHFRTGYYAPVN